MNAERLLSVPRSKPSILSIRHKLPCLLVVTQMGQQNILNHRLLKRGQAWVAVLGANSRDGIAGFGPTVETALHSFDAQYLRYLRAPIAA